MTFLPVSRRAWRAAFRSTGLAVVALLLAIAPAAEAGEAFGTIVIEKVTVPAGGTGFDFSDTIEEPNFFSLDDGGSMTFTNVPTGFYEVTEAATEGWELSDINCVDPTQNSSGDGQTAFIGLETDETVTCTFTNVALSNVGFSKTFLPDTIGPGGTAQLRFDISNVESQTLVTDLSFTDLLPAGITLADPPSAFTDCTGGVLTLGDDPDSISLSGGGLGANQACSVTVNVVGTATATNVSGDLTSSDGSSGPATATLTVDPARPGFSKVFSPGTISLGHTSTLTFTIDNSAQGAVDLGFLTFNDGLPAGMLIASPANAGTDCGNPAFPPTLSATPGTTSISFTASGFLPSFPVLVAGATCTVSVDVTTESYGVFVNTSGELTSNNPSSVSSGFATATLEVPVEFLVKSFVDDPVPPGGTVTLRFIVTNLDRDFPATAIAFDDPLPAGLTFNALDSDDCGGTLDTGTPSLLSYSGGVLAAGGSCTLQVVLDVPQATSAGTYANVTSAITATVDGEGIVGNMATDDLVVNFVPILTKEFTNDPVGGGGSVSLEFTITNTSPDFPMSDLAFVDLLPDVLFNAVSPPASVCNGGSLVFTPLGQFSPARIDVSGGSLSGGETCTFTVDLLVTQGAPGGVYPNITSEITGVFDSCGDGCIEPVTGPPASDDLVVVGAPQIVKEFTDDPAQPGGTVTLLFTLTHSEFAVGDATDIAFSDNLAATLPGLTATGATVNTCGGMATSSFPTSNFGYAGGSLMPGQSCNVELTLDVPPSAPAGSHTNTTSNIVATVAGVEGVVGLPASDELEIVGLVLTKEFTDDPVLPGGVVTLRFTLENVHPTDDATAIFFTDNLGAALPGLSAPGPLTTGTCDGSLTGTTTLVYSDGSLLSGQSCFFDVVLDVPGGAANGVYNNVTSVLLATLGDLQYVGEPARDFLTVDSNLLQFSKQFVGDPVVPGGTVTLDFLLTNLADESINLIAFTDDLDAALSGLVATGATFNDCGGMASGFPTGLFDYQGGSLAAGASCTISLDVGVPTDAPLGTTATNITSEVTGLTASELPVTGDPAIDDLLIAIDFSKEFSGLATAGGTVTLTFFIENPSQIVSLSDLSFLDDLDAVIPGLEATGLPMNDVCGAGSLLTGTSLLSLTGGNLLPGGSCTIAVTLMVPPTAMAGSYLNTTSELSAQGLLLAAPATATLGIEPPPTFAKSFAPNPIFAGQASTLTFTIDNSASALAATALDFTDNLPAGLVVAAVPNAATDCTGGTVTADAGTGVVAYTGGSVAAGASCTVQADVTSSVPSAYANTTGDLTSSSGNSGTASDTLIVEAPPLPGFTKEFMPDLIPQNDVSTLLFTIDNTKSELPATGLDFTDNLPAGVVVATPANASTDCTGGVLTATAGSGVISYSGGSVAALASCTVQADVTSSLAGIYKNVSGDLTSSAGNSGPAVAVLEVVDGIPPQVTNVDSVQGTGDGELEECETARTSVTALEVTFDEAMYLAAPGDPNSVTNPDNWLVVGAGPDKDLSTTVCGPTMGDDVATAIDEVTYDAMSLAATVTFEQRLADAPYRLIACSGGLADSSLNPLDGDGDGSGGDDFVRTFRVDRRDAFANGNFDCTLDGWTTSSVGEGGSSIVYSSEDVDNAGISGSAEFTNLAGNVDLSIGQCVGVVPESLYALRGFVRLNTGGVTVQAIRTCEFFASSDCSGPAFPVQAYFTTLSAPGVWQYFANEVVILGTYHSGVCQLTLRSAAGLPYSANADDLSMDAVYTMILFQDGFESGDTSAWSQTVP